MTAAPQTRRLTLDRPLDLRLTLAPTRIGKGDPCTRLRSNEAFRASRTPLGPATMHLRIRDAVLEATAWGEGAEWALEQLPTLVGANDTSVLQTRHPLISDLQRRLPGLRLGATERVLEALVPAVCAQQVSPFEAKRAYRQIMEAFGEPAPAGAGIDLLVPPHPRTLASTSHQEFHPIGLERARADIIRRAAARAATVEAVVTETPDDAEQRLRSIAGIGVWTAAMVRQAALGDPDAVPVGDLSLKHLVTFALTGERRGTDAQMLELLEPFRGQRGRVIRLLKAAKLGPPRRETR